jgi:hypothetical protein
LLNSHHHCYWRQGTRFIAFASPRWLNVFHISAAIIAWAPDVFSLIRCFAAGEKRKDREVCAH